MATTSDQTPATAPPAGQTPTDKPKPKKKKPQEDFASSVRWSAFSKYGAQGMQFGISMVLARLLAPEYFGLLGMATVVTGFVKVFRNLGFSSAIVQRKELSDDLLSTLFWVNLGVCLLVAAIVLGISPLAAWMYDDPRVMPIIAVLSITFVFAGFTMVPSALLTRRMEFKKLAIREIGGVAAAGLTAIPLAWLGWGVWALVGSTLASSFARMVLINLAIPFRPRLVYDRQGLSECLKFGLNLTGFNIFNYFARNADNLIIGMFLGPVALGYYSLAYKLMLLPRDSVSQVVTRVLFPKLSKLQDDDERLADVYLRATGAIALVTFPLMAGLAVLAEPFVLVVLGEKWLPAVPLIQILAPLGALQSLWNTAGQIFLAKGRADLHMRWGIGASMLFICCFFAGVPWGVIGVATAYLLACLAWIPVWFAVAFELVPTLSLSLFTRNVYPYLWMSVCMGTSVLAIRWAVSTVGLSDTAILATGIITGTASYTLLQVMYRPPATRDAIALLPHSLGGFCDRLLPHAKA